MYKSMTLVASVLLTFALFIPALTISKLQTVARRNSDDSAVFTPALPALKTKTRVPLRLPTYLATEDETATLYAIVEAAAPTYYEVQLAFDPECNGGNACHYGAVSGRVAKPGGKRLRGRAVKLAMGIIGYFVDAACGANCSDSTLSWNQDGFRYMVGIKAANLKTLTKVANAAIKGSEIKP